MTSQPASEPATPVEAPVPEASAAKPHRSKAPLAAVVALVTAGAAAWVTYPLWIAPLEPLLEPFQAPSPAADETDTLRAELSAATARIAQLEARAAAAPAAMDNARLDRLEEALKAAPAGGAAPSAELASLAQQVADLRRNSADSSAVLRLTERLDKVEAALRDLQVRRASAGALLLAAGQLREAVAAGRPYDSEWRTAQVVAGEDRESLALLDALKDKAAGGIAPRAALARRFETLAPALIRAEILPEGDGWWKPAADRLLSLVTIRREDGAALGHNTAAIVGRAQAAIGRDDLEAALAELAALGSGPAEAAAPWMAEAKARLAADQALSRLTAQAVALAGSGVRAAP